MSSIFLNFSKLFFDCFSYLFDILIIHLKSKLVKYFFCFFCVIFFVFFLKVFWLLFYLLYILYYIAIIIKCQVFFLLFFCASIFCLFSCLLFTAGIPTSRVIRTQTPFKPLFVACNITSLLRLLKRLKIDPDAYHFLPFLQNFKL